MFVPRRDTGSQTGGSSGPTLSRGLNPLRTGSPDVLFSPIRGVTQAATHDCKKLVDEILSLGDYAEGEIELPVMAGRL